MGRQGKGRNERRQVWREGRGKGERKEGKGGGKGGEREK